MAFVQPANRIARDAGWNTTAGDMIVAVPPIAPSFTRELQQYKRVAVFQPRPGLGDLIWHLPHIHAIAAASHGKRITLITKPSTQADTLLRDDPAIEAIVWFDRNPRIGRGRHDGLLGFARLVVTLRSCRADACVLLHHGASLAFAQRLAGIPHRYGYGYGVQRRWLNHSPFLGADVQFAEAFDQATAYTDAAGLTNLAEPAVVADAQAQATTRARLGHLPRPWAALGIGCNGAIRQWGAANFARLAVALRAHGIGSLLLVAAAHEAPVADAVLAQLPDHKGMHAVLGWNLPEIAALLAESDIFIGNDSGLMNLRAALGQPAYGLFGASGPLRHSALIHPIVPPGGARAGMDKITVQQVVDAVMKDPPGPARRL